MSIRIKWLSDDADAIRGNKAVKDSLRDVADESDDATDEMSRDFREAARDADDAADKIKRSYRTTYRDVEAAADDAADSARRASRRMSEQSKEAGQEIRQNLGEGIANAARGDFESLSDTIGDTLGGAVSGIGGIGTAAAAAAGAAGLGLIIAGINAQVEAADLLRERLSGAYSEAIQEGRSYIDVAQVIADLQDLMFNKDRAGEYNRLLDDQKKLGLDIEVLAGANLGRQEDLAAVQERINTLKEQGSEIDRGTDSILGDVDTQLAGIENRWKNVQTETEIQQEKVKELEAAEARAQEGAREQIDRTAAAAEARYEAMRAKYANPIVARLQVVDQTDYNTLRQAVQRRLGVFSAPVQLGPGIGRRLEG